MSPRGLVHARRALFICTVFVRAIRGKCAAVFWNGPATTVFGPRRFGRLQRCPIAYGLGNLLTREKFACVFVGTRKNKGPEYGGVGTGKFCDVFKVWWDL